LLAIAVKRSATRPSHTPWSKAEMDTFKMLVATEGATKWEDKARKLGTGRTAKALHTRWMRDQGRIIDRPRMKDAKAKLKQQAAQPSAGSVSVQVAPLAAAPAAPVAAAAGVLSASATALPTAVASAIKQEPTTPDVEVMYVVV
jgi:hypothetical protein